jgi:hypothetical protein
VWTPHASHAQAQAQAQAQAPPLPRHVRVSLASPCTSALFDGPAYLRALDVELFTLGVSRLAPGAPDAVDPAGPQIELTVSSPDCRSELLLSLHAGERADAHVVRVSELPTLGRERALSLLSVERLQRAWPELAGVELSSAPEPTPVEKTAVSPKPAATGEPGARSRWWTSSWSSCSSASRKRR